MDALVMSDYAARYRAARGYAGLTQDQLGERLGTTGQTIKQREAGRQAPKRGELLAVAAICDVPTAFMEHGFGELRPSEVAARLERIEELLLDSGLEPLRDFVRAWAAAQGADVAADESPEPGLAPGRGQRRGER